MIQKVTSIKRKVLTLIGIPPKNETGYDNARRFVEHVRLEAQTNKIIVMYGDGVHDSPSIMGVIRSGWKWMGNEAWRAYVLNLIVEHKVPITEYRFSPPDELGDWVFVAQSTVGIKHITQLSLDDVA